MAEETLLLEIGCELDPASAGAERDRILARLDAHGDGPIAISLASGAATQPSLQIYFATLKEARLRGLPLFPAAELVAARAECAGALAEDGPR